MCGTRTLLNRMVISVANLAWRLRDRAGQGTVEYMLIIVILIAPMAAALTLLFDAFETLYNKLGYLIGRPYP
jgi:Flp pilus assembly pilin Flp